MGETKRATVWPAQILRRAFMAVKLNRRAFEYAEELIRAGRTVLDDRDAWSEHRPTSEAENQFISDHGIAEYGTWHLGVDDEKDPNTKAHYKFIYGDFEKVHRCGVL